MVLVYFYSRLFLLLMLKDVSPSNARFKVAFFAELLAIKLNIVNLIKLIGINVVADPFKLD